MITPSRLQVLLPDRPGGEGRLVLSFKFIAIAYGMLGATAATGYIAQGGGGSGAAGKRAADPPKVERVAMLEMPSKSDVMPQIAMATSARQDPAPTPAPVAAPVAAPVPVMAAAPVTTPAVMPSAMPL